MGAPRRAKASYLTDAGVEKQRFVAASDRYNEATGSAIRRAGTLSGIATGARIVCGRRVCVDDEKTGPVLVLRSDQRFYRTGPDYAMVTDRSEARPGVRGAGVRTGTEFRLVGTSTAAPQLGRCLAAKALPKSPQIPNPERTGNGRIDPLGPLIGPE